MIDTEFGEIMVASSEEGDCISMKSPTIGSNIVRGES